jgi:membrane associated rhomboid family serine protease
VAISGAVSAVIGAYFIFYPLTKIRLLVIYATVEVPTVVCFAIWFLFHLTGPLLPIVGGVAKTAWLASVFGFLMGAVVAFFKKRTS